MRGELQLVELFKKCKTHKGRIKVRRERAGSAPSHINHNREQAQMQRVQVHTQEL